METHPHPSSQEAEGGGSLSSSYLGLDSETLAQKNKNHKQDNTKKASTTKQNSNAGKRKHVSRKHIQMARNKRTQEQNTESIFIKEMHNEGTVR